jgi:glycosyltransferase involved in cell wall biosynthesis
VSAPSPLRVGIIANTYDPDDHYAGGFVHLLESASRWSGVELTVLAPTCVRPLFEGRMRVARYLAAPDLLQLGRAAKWLLRGLLTLRAGARLRSSCDVVIVLSHLLPDMLPATIFGRRRCAVYLWHFMEPPSQRDGDRLRNFLAYGNELAGKWLAMRCRALIVGTQRLARLAGIADRAGTFVTTNGVDHLVAADGERARRGAIYVGRLYPTKRVEDLVEAWALLDAPVRAQGLAIVGQGPVEYVQQLQRRIDELGVRDSIVLMAGVDDARKATLLQAARVFAFPSGEEGWGIAIAEAMGAGLPCVTYDLDVYREVFPQGRVAVALGDIAGFAAALGGLLAGDTRCAQLAGEASQLARGFTWQRASEIDRSALEYVDREAASLR